VKEITAGSVALKNSGRNIDRISRETGASYEQVGQWISGHRKPSAKWRPVLLEKYKIPIPAWDETPTEGGLLANLGKAPPPAAAPAPTEAPANVRGMAESMIRQIRDLQVKAETDPLMTPDDRAKTLARAATVLTAVARLTGEAGDIPEAKLLRTPAFARVRDAMIVALTPWPEAMRAVGEALARLEV
jgi:hypothetical protein